MLWCRCNPCACLTDKGAPAAFEAMAVYDRYGCPECDLTASQRQELRAMRESKAAVLHQGPR
ncbi:MAG TPA: hypothetical protein VFG59_09135 [Anaeromyxobacter sp.]|nr:hypothetical protein [Anaeromyxobacter sp.]